MTPTCCTSASTSNKVVRATKSVFGHKKTLKTEALKACIISSKDINSKEKLQRCVLLSELASNCEPSDDSY